LFAEFGEIAGVYGYGKGAEIIGLKDRYEKIFQTEGFEFKVSRDVFMAERYWIVVRVILYVGAI
jgi:hypothetical protein